LGFDVVKLLQISYAGYRTVLQLTVLLAVDFYISARTTCDDVTSC